MTLCEVKTRDEFQEYYKQNGLKTTAKRVEHLMEATGVMAIRGDGAGKNRETLALLEESALLGYWRTFGDVK